MRYWLCNAVVASMFLIAGACVGGSTTTLKRGEPPPSVATTTAIELRGGGPTGPRAGLPAGVDDRKNRDDAPAPHAVIAAAWDGNLPGNDMKAGMAGIAGALLVVGSLLARRSARPAL